MVGQGNNTILPISRGNIETRGGCSEAIFSERGGSANSLPNWEIRKPYAFNRKFGSPASASSFVSGKSLLKTELAASVLCGEKYGHSDFGTK